MQNKFTAVSELHELETYIRNEKPKGESEFKYRVILMIVAIIVYCLLYIGETIESLKD